MPIYAARGLTQEMETLSAVYTYPLMESCYVYIYEIDGVVRYVGRGRDYRMGKHLAKVNCRRQARARGEAVKPHVYDLLEWR
jgi:hypothetical protein